ncbi:MAG: DUF1573 domain-containing protein [Planctomycetia bacterium]|nr:DUF1573 domain-containing protein [Planctomycetia bacterium]
MTLQSFNLCLLTLLIAVAGCQRTNTNAPTAPASSQTGSPAKSMALPLELVAGDGNLGSTDFGEEKTCSFKLKNNLAKAITLELKNKSCTCASVNISPSVLEPQQECTVTLLWTPRTEVLESSTFRIWAEIGDSDNKNQLRLEATGTLDPLLMVAFPRGPFAWGKLSLGDLDKEAVQLVAEVFSRKDNFKTSEVKFQSPGLEVVSITPLPAERLQDLKAKGGYRITVKPTKALSHGEFQQELVVLTSLRDKPLLIPTTGIYDTSSISLSAEKISLPPRLSVLHGYRVAPIQLTVRFGEARSCELIDISPKLFQGKVTKVNDKTWKIELSLIQDAALLKQRFSPNEWKKLCNYGFDLGHIQLKLDHPEVKMLTIPMTGSMLVPE